jgi:hypothetical protein
MSPKKDVLLTKLYFKLEGFCSFVWGGTRRRPTIVKTERFGEAQARANCYVCLDACMDGWVYVCMDGVCMDVCIPSLQFAHYLLVRLLKFS